MKAKEVVSYNKVEEAVAAGFDVVIVQWMDYIEDKDFCHVFVASPEIEHTISLILGWVTIHPLNKKITCFYVPLSAYRTIGKLQKTFGSEFEFQKAYLFPTQ